MALLELFAPVLQAVVAAAFTGLFGLFAPRALAVAEARTGIKLTEQQRQTLLGAAQTAAGILQTKLDQGVLNIGRINTTDPAVLNEASAAIARVPVAAAALQKSVSSMAETIVGMVDTAAKPSVAWAAADQISTTAPGRPRPIMG
jgi:hypothetical protein